MSPERFPRYVSVFRQVHQELARYSPYSISCDPLGVPYFLFHGLVDPQCPYARHYPRSIGSPWGYFELYFFSVLRGAYWGSEVSFVGPLPWVGWGRALENRWTEFDGVAYLLGCLFEDTEREFSYFSRGLLDGLLERESLTVVRWLLRGLFMSCAPWEAERTSFLEVWSTLPSSEGEFPEKAVWFLNEHFQGPKESPLGSIVDMFTAEPSEDTPACLVGVLSLHEESWNLHKATSAYWLLGWEDWTVASSLSDLIPRLAKEQGEACLPSLQRAYHNPHENCRQLVVQAVGEIGSVKGLAFLLTALRDPSEWVRLSALEALTKLGSLAKPAIESMRSALSSEEGPLREKLYHLLQTLEPSSFEGFRSQLEELLFS
ncbi:MAG: HEAT repeat domain-containing protein [Myxococcales bacterium]|nr:HEAT repeat domain-containing protein [Myxococcales bacterium]